MGLQLRCNTLKTGITLGQHIMAKPGLGTFSRLVQSSCPGSPPVFIYREKQKRAHALSKNVVNQIRKLINRHIHYHFTRGRLPEMFRNLKQGVGQELKRQAGKHDALQKEMALLRKLWNTAFSRSVREGASDPTPQVLKKTALGLGGRVPVWLKSKLRVMARTGDVPLNWDRTVLLVRPPAGSSTRLEDPGHSGSREGLQTLLNLLNAVPETSPALRRLVRSIRRRNLPVTLLPSHSGLPSSPKNSPKEEAGSGALHLRKPFSGVLRMRIEPPEAARALAQHLPLDNIPLIFKKPPANPSKEKQDKAASQRSRVQATTAAARSVDLELSEAHLQTIAEATRKTLSKDLLTQLPPAQVRRLADQVYRVIENKLTVERHRRGLR